MNETINPDPDGAYRIKGDRPNQLRTIADTFAAYLKGSEAWSDELLADTRFQPRRLEGMCEQLRIIAAEIERRPEAGVFAQRILDMLELHAGSTSMYQRIIEILEDPYAHLDTVQRETIRSHSAEIMASTPDRDGGTAGMTIAQARGYIVDWSIQKMIEWAGEDLTDRLDFDPRTGEPWEAD